MVHNRPTFQLEVKQPDLVKYKQTNFRKQANKFTVHCSVKGVLSVSCPPFHIVCVLLSAVYHFIPLLA